MYLVIEIQKFDDGTVATPPLIVKSTFNEGESEYCRIRSIAAISSVPQHSVVFMNDEGLVYDSKCYKHGIDKPADALEG